MVIKSGSLVPSPEALEISVGNTVDSISTGVSAAWEWYKRSQGIVSWNFSNDSYFQETVVLYRNGYYFGNAFWPVYVESGLTSWATKISPLIDRGIERNTAPIGIVDFGDGKKIIAFIFTLSPGQEWSMLEGGFSPMSPPANAVLYGTTLEKSGQFCIGYDRKQVADYDSQTGDSLKGMSQNPSNVSTLEVSISTFARYVQLFAKDTVLESACPENPTYIQEAAGVNAPGDLEEIIGNVVRIIRNF